MAADAKDDLHLSSHNFDGGPASSFSSEIQEDDIPMQSHSCAHDTYRVESDDANEDITRAHARVQDNRGTSEYVEATPESDQRCGLKNNVCSEPMDQLMPKNSGLVVNTPSPGGRLFGVHVAVEDGELKEPPILGHTKRGLFEADVDSEWYEALEDRNCLSIIAQLKGNPCLLLQMGPEGMTVLHAAVKRGCLPLLQQVVDLFDDGAKQFVDVKSGRKCSERELLRAKYGASKSTTYDLVTLNFGAERSQMSSIASVKLAISLSVEIQAPKELGEVLLKIIQKVSTDPIYEPLVGSFREDLNYNFAHERQELCFLYACQEYHREATARGYVHDVILRCAKQRYPQARKVLGHLFHIKNAQGQTPLHAWAKASWWRLPDSEILFLKEIGGDHIPMGIIDVCDARGWTILHMAAAGGHLNLLKYIVQDGRAEVSTRTKNKEASTALHLATRHGRRDCVDLLFSSSSFRHIHSRGLSEAYERSQWYDALHNYDCKSLMSQLRDNPGLLLQTGSRGITVLHAAVIRGCTPLFHQIIAVFDEQGEFEDTWSRRKGSEEELLCAKGGDSRSIPFELATLYLDGLDKYNERTTSEGILELSSRFRHIQSTMETIPGSAVDKKLEDLRDELLKAIEEVSSGEEFLFLVRSFGEDGNYNFASERKDLYFHYACEKYPFEETAPEFVQKVLETCLRLRSKSKDVLKYLFNLKNMQGRNPLHAWVYGVHRGLDDNNWVTPQFLEPDFEFDYAESINAYDARGWTILHVIAARGQDRFIAYILKDRQAEWGKRTKDNKLTALHLAILHGHQHCVELLLECSYATINDNCQRRIRCGYNSTYQDAAQLYFDEWTPLQLAAITGRSNVVRALLKKVNYVNDRGINQKNPISPLFFAAASGDSETLRLFLDNDQFFDPLVTYKGATSLHFAVVAELSYVAEGDGNFFLLKSDFADDLHLEKDFKFDNEIELLEKEHTTTYHGRKECIIMLLQSGLDVWEKNDDGRFPELGPCAPAEARHWWQQEIAKETQEARKGLNETSNAISIVAALVATASFVGPLQPPLGWGTSPPDIGLIQVSNSYIRIFVVSNSLSFYLAIASIMFAVVPYLPMPQESLYEEWKRTRRTVAKAASFLLSSVISVLVSFAAASNVGMSEEYSWDHQGLTFYPAILGGLLCLFGIFLLFLRSLLLIYSKNRAIRRLYRFLGKI